MASEKHNKWYIVLVSEFGETVSYPELITAIKDVFGQDCEFFVPINQEKMGSYISTSLLFEGYVFVKDSSSVKKKIMAIKDNRVFSGLLKSCGKIQMLSSREIGSLRRKLKFTVNKNIQAGTMVKINDGVFQNLEGEVQSTEDNGKVANIKIVCLSRTIIAPIPTSCLEIA